MNWLEIERTIREKVAAERESEGEEVAVPAVTHEVRETVERGVRRGVGTGIEREKARIALPNSTPNALQIQTV